MTGDKIIMQEMAFYGYHGVLPTEKIQGQKFLVSIEINLDLARAGKTDNLGDTLNYADIYQEVRGIVKGKSFNLLEALAQEIARKILLQEVVQGIRVLIKKPWAPLPGNLDFVGVEIWREKEKDRGN